MQRATVIPVCNAGDVFYDEHNLDYTDLLCEMSQKYGGLILNENWNGKRCRTQVHKEK